MLHKDPDTREFLHTDLTIPAACSSCGGDLELRVAPGSSHAYCGSCRWLSRPRVTVRNGVMQVAQPLLAEA